MLTIPRSLYQQMIAHLQQVHPQEGCGLLSGLNGYVSQVYPIDNRLQSRTAYEMEPLQQIKAMLAIEAQAEQLLGIYHSHPTGPAWPSETDIAQAYYPEAIYLIISLQDQTMPSLAGFRLEAEHITQVSITIE